MAGVSVKMGVEGVSQFKQDMKTAQTAVKTLDEQLKLNEKQFKATGDAEAYMQQKAELLRAKLAEQKSVVASAEKALENMTRAGTDPASAAFQKMQQQLLRAKSDMLDTQTAMSGLGDAGEDVAEKSEAANEQLKHIGDGVDFQNVTSAINRITDGLENVAKKALRAGSAIVKEVLGAGGWADDINTRSKVLGISTDELQRMEKTAKIIDTDAETIVKARQKLMRGVGSGTKGTMDALEALGIKYSGDAEDTFWKAGEAIMGLSDEAEQEARANELFGKSWRELIPLFSEGRDEYERINSTWNVLSQEQLDSLNKMDDEYQKLQIALEDLKVAALTNLAEPMEKALTAINEILGRIGEGLNSEEGKATVDNVVTAITDGMKWIVDNKETVIGALSAIVAGWGALKLTGGALNILQLVNGLKGLTGMGAGAGSGGAAAKAAGTAAAKTIGGVSMSGGISVLGPLAAMGAAGYAGVKLLEANLNDENLNQIYGDSQGLDLLDRMTEEQYRLAKEYERLYTLGGEEAMDARDALQASLQRIGIHNDEQGVGLLENIFEERLNENDIDGMVAKFDRMAEVYEEDSAATNNASKEMSKAADEMRDLPGETAAAVHDELSGMAIYMDAEAIGRVLTPRIGGGLGVALKAVIK